MLGPDGTTVVLPLTRVGDTRLEARAPLSSEGAYRPVLRTGKGRFLRLPAVTLPYSPEFEPRLTPDEGERTLRELVRTAEGRLDPPAEALMAGGRASVGVTPLDSLVTWLALACLLLEIFVRRIRPAIPSLDSLPPLRALAAAARSWRARRQHDRDGPEAWERTTAPPSEDPPADEPAAPEAPPPPTPEDDDIASVLDRAKRRRRRR